MYPIMLNLENKKVLVVGGGRIARRKVEFLQGTGASVTVISPILEDSFKNLEFNWLKMTYKQGLANEYFLVFACTNKKEVNQLVVKDCKEGQLVNDTSCQNHSNFFNMAVISNKECLIGISTYGKNPSKSKLIKHELLKWLKNFKFD
ncbi:hypothetical protein CBF31_03470 [Vagococcus fessus]|uniref:precorrin-2 dehydrogenase n=2 Tax=Vagococcus fessus TaxID=120370 RepID=A0A430ADK3_9ENTE|nr:hypothetical protein CBF31_03470 [Vagococcus fessus]